MSITDQDISAGIAWLSGYTSNYPSLTIGDLAGATANVVDFKGVQEPYYELGFYDPNSNFSQDPTDHILMIENQSSTLNGNTMALDPNSTLFDLYDNTTGVYLQGGQIHTLAGWFGTDSFLAGESLRYVEIGFGYAGSSGPGVSFTVNSVDLAVPEPTSLLLLLTLVGATGLGVRVKRLRNRRS